MDIKRKGILRYRQRQRDPWQETQLWDKRLPAFSSVENVQNLLVQLTPPGVSEKKQKHLYEKVRKYIPEEFQDRICPKPVS